MNENDIDIYIGDEEIDIYFDGVYVAQNMGGGSVDSVNGQTGVVVLDAGDVGADTLGSASSALASANSYTDSEISGIDFPVDSVNGETGTVILNADDIDDTTTTHKFTTAGDTTKLAGIEALADVTDVQNVGSSIHGASAKTTPVDADTMPLIDSAASNVLKKVTWANIKSTIKAYYDAVSATLTNKTIDADNNTVSNIVVSNFKASAVVIESEGISSNDNDTTLPTSAAVKDYVDNASGPAEWGNIEGTLSDQTDLQAALDAKVNKTTTVNGQALSSNVLLDTDDVSDSGATNKYVTAAEKTKLSNLSGTNTGDQTATTLPVTPTGNLASSDAQSALAELQGDIDTINTSLGGLTDAVVLKGSWDASAGTFPGSGAAQAGWTYIVSVAGTVNGVAFALGDRLLAIVDNASATTFAGNWFKLDYTDQVLSVNTLTGAVVLNQDNIGDGTTYKQYSQTEKTKLAGIETAADVTDAQNVGSSIDGATAKTTPVDADTLPLIDSAASNVLKKVTWANIKATIKSYYDAVTSTFTNKTFDANGTGNSITNLEVADFAASAIVIESEGITANDNDTTIPTSAAVKDYVDNATPSVSGSNAPIVDQSGGTSDTYGVLSGSVNGSNTVFTVSHASYVSGSLKVYLNGQLQTQGSGEDWVETTPASGTFTFNSAPRTGDLITAVYYTNISGVTDTKSITVETPTNAEDITMFFTDAAITIWQMNAVLVGSSTPSVTWTVRHSTDRSATGNEVVTSGTTTTSITSGSEVTSFNDATIPAGSWVWLETTAKSGTVGSLNVTLSYDIDL